MAEIVLENVSKSYAGGATAVKDLSLTIADGEFIILVGPSGCGKSTTLNMIAGLEDISSGDLRIGGERVNEKAPKDRDIAMVFQSYALYPHMTVRQNIAFPLTLAKLGKDEIARLQSRLGTTTVYVTHDQTEAMTLGDRVVVMLAGVAQQIGTPEELYNTPTNLFVAGFIGSPGMNFFPATLTDGGIKLPFGEEVVLTDEAQRILAQHPKPSNVIAGLRPEHFDDAALVDSYTRIRGLTFEVDVDLVESLGADKYLHFRTEGSGAKSAQLAELAAESGVGENEFVARVSADSKVSAGKKAELAVDTSKLIIFDGDTGINLSIPPAG